MKPTLYEAIKDITWIVLIILFYVIFPVVAICSTTYILTHHSNQSTYSCGSCYTMTQMCTNGQVEQEVSEDGKIISFKCE